jgi:hypothetical protein
MPSQEIDPNAFSLEFLMSTPPEALSALDLQTIVQYHRNVRADRSASATRRSRKGETAPSEIPTGIKELIAKRKPSMKLSRRGL